MKMLPQQLLLSWKDHNGALMSVFENLLKRNTLVDCTLAAEGQYVKAHKVVLSACSSYFELLFSQESEKNPIVILKDVKFQELEAAINFMYRGEVEVCEDRLAAFLEVADSLQIKGLGSDGKSHDARGKYSSQKSSKAAVPPKAHSSRKEVTLTESFSVTRMKTEDSTSEHMAGATTIEHVSSEDAAWMQDSGGVSAGGTHFASVFFKEQPLGPDPGPAPLPGPAPAPGPAPGSGLAPARHGCARGRTAQRGTSTVAPRGCRFQCSHCGYATNDSHHFVRHQRVHTGEKPYKCTYCPFSASQLGNLNMHMRTHTGERPYKCTFCPFSASRSGHLNVHMRRHTGEKPYVCSQCGSSFRHASYLKKHSETHRVLLK